jgi:SAM-dependent methyltransferase
LAAQRGEPSYVWRSGQERRLKMIDHAAPLANALILVDGCGVGTYAGQFARRFTPHVEAIDIEPERVAEAQHVAPHALVAAAEAVPYPSNAFDLVLSNEVIEHVRDDRAAIREMVRVTRPGGRIVIFCPNRWYPFETHGHYWNKKYHFGNTPLINYLPDGWRNQLAPHVRVYTAGDLQRLFNDLPVRVVSHTRIFGGYDNIVARLPLPGKALRSVLYALEKTPFRFFGLSHLLVLTKTEPT